MKPLQRDTEMSNRGQTTLDFAFGIGIFLLAIAFIFMFIPNLIAPFNTPSEGGDKIQAERTADYLVTHVLAADSENTQATTLDPECTDAFFEESKTPPSHCGFTNKKFDSTTLGLDSSTNIQIQLQPLDPAGTTRSVGDNPPTSRNVQQWSRLVYHSGQTYTLRVRVW